MIRVAIYLVASLGGLFGIAMIVVAVVGERINKAITKAWGR